MRGMCGRRLYSPWGTLLLGLALAMGFTPGFAPAPSRAAAPILTPASFADLEGFSHQDLRGALLGFRRSCPALARSPSPLPQLQTHRGIAPPTPRNWKRVCALAQGIIAPSRAEARAFFMTHFRPFFLEIPSSSSLITGYYEAQAHGSLTPSPRYPVPLYRTPKGLDPTRPFLTRREIEAGALRGQNLEIVWLSSWIDAFFLHIQGSGRIRLTDGSVMRVGFSAKNGRPYTSIGQILKERGILPRDQITMETLRAWLHAHPERGRALTWENQSYIFFKVLQNQRDQGPPGALGTPLIPNVSVAVDRRHWPLGVPLWVETTLPQQAGKTRLHRLFIAQDTGSAIVGPARLDVFFGAGETAAFFAGNMKERGKIWVLLPK